MREVHAFRWLESPFYQSVSRSAPTYGEAKRQVTGDSFDGLGWGEKHNQALNFLSRPISRQSFFLTEILRKFTSRLALGVSHTGPLTRVGGKAGVMGRKVL